MRSRRRRDHESKRLSRKRKAITERVGEREHRENKAKNAYLNAGTRHLVPSAGGSIPSVNLLGTVAAPDGIINASGGPHGGTGEFIPGVVVVVPLVDRVA